MAKGDTTGRFVVPDYGTALERMNREPGTFLFSSLDFYLMETYRNMSRSGRPMRLVTLPPEGKSLTGLILPKNSPLTEMLNIGIMKMRQSGTMASGN